MGIVGRVRRQLTVLKDWHIPQRVVFHHVPKCGGTSVALALRKRYILSQGTVKPQESFEAFQMFTGRDDREAMLRDVLDLREQMLLYLLAEDVRCVSAHVRFSAAAHRHFAPRYKFVTILREPVSRFISNYGWSYDRKGAFARIDLPLDDFLETPRARAMGAAYVENFCGFGSQEDMTTPQAVAAAIANLKKFDVVGRLDRFAADMKSALGVRLRIGHDNKKGVQRPITAAPVTEAQRARITALCAPDLEIWRQFTGAPHGG